MTNQEVFDKVVKHLRAQGRKAVSDSMAATCRYRTEEGLKCAVGCLIPDNEYNPSFEGYSVGSLQAGGRASPKSLARLDRKLLLRMQAVHDHHVVPEWEHQFTEVAKEFNLTVPS